MSWLNLFLLSFSACEENTVELDGFDSEYISATFIPPSAGPGLPPGPGGPGGPGPLGDNASLGGPSTSSSSVYTLHVAFDTEAVAAYPKPQVEYIYLSIPASVQSAVTLKAYINGEDVIEVSILALDPFKTNSNFHKV